MTVKVKTMDNQRWVCRTQLFQFIGTSLWDPGEQVDELAAHHPPAVARAAKGLLLVRFEARLHEEEACARRRGHEREGHDGVHIADHPRVAELPMRFDLEDPAIH